MVSPRRVSKTDSTAFWKKTKTVPDFPPGRALYWCTGVHPMLPEQFFDVAQHLGSGDEARERSAVSRLYYSAFHTAVGHFNLSPPDQGAHNDVINRLRGRGRYSRQNPLNDLAGRQLRNLKTRREIADYDLDDEWPDGSLTEAWSILGRFQGAL